jgi:predicted kinase
VNRDFTPGTLVVAVGPAGAGKSTFADAAVVDAVVCLDHLRREIGGDAGDQSVTPAAVARHNLRAPLGRGRGTSPGRGRWG